MPLNHRVNDCNRNFDHCMRDKIHAQVCNGSGDDGDDSFYIIIPVIPVIPVIHTAVVNPLLKFIQ